MGEAVPAIAGLPFDPRYHALNVLDGKRYAHHPVMSQVESRVYRLERDFGTFHKYYIRLNKHEFNTVRQYEVRENIYTYKTCTCSSDYM